MSQDNSLTVLQRNFIRSCAERASVLSLSFGEPIDRARWKEAWEEVRQAHSILQAGFKAEGSGFKVVDQTGLSAAWDEPDWSGVPMEELAEKWKHTLQGECEQPLRADGERPWRLKLLNLPGSNSHLLFSYHPSLLDHTSLFLILRDWLAAYEKPGSVEARGDTDYFTTLQEAAALEQNPLAFWNQFSEGPAFTGVFDCLPKPDGTSAAADQSVLSESLDSATADGITALAGRFETQPGLIFAAAWGMMLSRLTADHAVVFDWQASARRLVEGTTSELAGQWEAAVPVVATEPAEGGLSEWLSGLVDDIWASEGAMFTDFNLLATLPAGQRGLSGASSLISYEARRLNDNLHTALPRWIAADAQVHEPSTHPLTVRVSGEGRYLVEMEYSASLFRAEDMSDLLRRFLLVLGQLAEARPELEFPMDSPRTTPLPYLRAEGLDEVELGAVLAQRIRLCGNESTAVFGEDVLTFDDIDCFANQLARQIRKTAGTQAKSFGVCLTVTPWLSVALLAALKEELPCLLLDAGSEESFCREKANAAGVEVMVVDSATEALFEGSGIKTITVDKDWEKISQLSDSPVQVKREGAGTRFLLWQGDLGVELDVGLISASVNQLIQKAGLESHHRILVTSGLSASLLEQVFAALATGAALVFPEDDVWATRSAFQEMVEKADITHLFISGSWWVQWMHYLAELNQQLPESLNHVFLEGGSYLPMKAREVWQRLAGEQLHLSVEWSPAGLDGISLTTPGDQVLASARRQGVIQVGQAADLAVGVLDQRGRALPPGFVGEVVLEAEMEAIGPKGHDLFSMTTRGGGKRHSWSSGKNGFTDLDGSYYLIPAQPGLSWKETAALRAGLESHPGVFDVWFSGTCVDGNRILDCWILPCGETKGLERGLQQHLSRLALPSDLKFRIAVLNRLPMLKDGRVDEAALPATAPVDTPPPRAAAAAVPVSQQATAPSPSGGRGSSNELRLSVGGLEVIVPAGDKARLVLLLEAGQARELLPALQEVLPEEHALAVFVLPPAKGAGSDQELLIDHCAHLVRKFIGQEPAHLVSAGKGSSTAVQVARRCRREDRGAGFLTLIDPELPSATYLGGVQAFRQLSQGLRKSLGIFKKRDQEQGNTRKGQEAGASLFYEDPVEILTGLGPSRSWSVAFPQARIHEINTENAAELARGLLLVLGGGVEKTSINPSEAAAEE